MIRHRVGSRLLTLITVWTRSYSCIKPRPSQSAPRRHPTASSYPLETLRPTLVSSLATNQVPFRTILSTLISIMLCPLFLCMRSRRVWWTQNWRISTPGPHRPSPTRPSPTRINSLWSTNSSKLTWRGSICLRWWPWTALNRNKKLTQWGPLK